MNNQSEKSTTNEWCFQSYHKKVYFSQLHKLYMFDPLIVFHFNFDAKVHFSYLLVLDWEGRERERGHWISMVEREK